MGERYLQKKNGIKSTLESTLPFETQWPLYQYKNIKQIRFILILEGCLTVHLPHEIK